MTHANGVVDLAFGPTARAGGAQPRFDAASGTCASTYCHGATLPPGGTVRTPSWTGGPSQAACGTCHGAPPLDHGPGATRCDLCHPGTVLPGGGIDLNGGMHVNGRIDVQRYHPDGWFSPTVHGLAANRDSRRLPAVSRRRPRRGDQRHLVRPVPRRGLAVELHLLPRRSEPGDHRGRAAPGHPERARHHRARRGRAPGAPPRRRHPAGGGLRRVSRRPGGFRT